MRTFHFKNEMEEQCKMVSGLRRNDNTGKTGI